MSWIGVDLDGTLAHYDGWKDGLIGDPIPLMAERVSKWIEDGKDVRIFTARASDQSEIPLIQDWTEKHFGVRLQITNQKDFAMVEFWDDLAIQVERNTGKRMDGKE